MSLDNLMTLLENRLEEVKIWKKIIEKPVIRKQSNIAKEVNEKIKEFAEAQVQALEESLNGIRKKVFLNDFVNVDEDNGSGSNEEVTTNKKKKEAAEDTSPKEKPDKVSHRDRKKQASVQKEYPIHTGQDVKLLSTQSLTAVNPKQLQEFVTGNTVKVAKVYTNQYGDDTVEIIKKTESGLVKGVVLLEDIEY